MLFRSAERRDSQVHARRHRNRRGPREGPPRRDPVPLRRQLPHQKVLGVVNFTSGYGMTHRFTYSTGESLGLANKLTFKAGNYFDPKQPIPVKVILIDTKGNSHYLVGTADAFYEFPVTTGLVDQELTFDAIEVASIRIVAKYGGQASAYLYVGNMQLTFAE